MISKSYFPILKTTTAEMRAIKNIDSLSLQKMMPAFELTKARKSKYDPDGDVFKRIKEIKSTMNEQDFILDLTNDETLSNPQIDSFFDDIDNWVEFIDHISIGYSGCITPTVLMFEDSTAEELRDSYHKLKEINNSVCVKIDMSTFYGNKNNDLKGNVFSLLEIVDEADYVIVDAGFIGNLNKDIIANYYTHQNNIRECVDLLKKTESIKPIKSIMENNRFIFSISCFPLTPIDAAKAEIDFKNNNHKNSGTFGLHSYNIYKLVIRDVSSKILYGDYGCIHPNRVQAKAFSWVHRIDYPLLDKIIYYRDKAGYAFCAKKIRELPEFQSDKIQCWGRDEIYSAANGLPNGLSPSYWISVRSNIHMTRMAHINER